MEAGAQPPPGQDGCHDGLDGGLFEMWSMMLGGSKEARPSKGERDEIERECKREHGVDDVESAEREWVEKDEHDISRSVQWFMLKYNVGTLQITNDTMMNSHTSKDSKANMALISLHWCTATHSSLT